MKKSITILAVFMTLFMATTVFAENLTRNMRLQADSEYRIAVKAYNRAVQDYGEALTGIPSDERESICKKFSSALYDNRWQADNEDIFNAAKYRRQAGTLEQYNKEICVK